MASTAGIRLHKIVIGTESSSDGKYTWNKYQYFVLDSKGNTTLKLDKNYRVSFADFGDGTGYFRAIYDGEHIKDNKDYTRIYSTKGDLIGKYGAGSSVALDDEGKYSLIATDSPDNKQAKIELLRLSDRKIVDTIDIKADKNSYVTTSTYSGYSGSSLIADAGLSTPDGYKITYYMVENGKLKETSKWPGGQTSKSNDYQIGTLGGTKLYFHFEDSGVYTSRDDNGKQVTIGDYKLQITKNYFNPSSAQRGNQDMYYAIDSKGKYGAVDSKGNVLINFEYDDIYDAGETDTNLILVKKDGGWYLYDTSYKEPEKPATSYVTMYRVYNRYSGEHLFTPDASERDRLVGLGWSDEGVGWYAPERSDTKVYRMYNPYSGDHLYTTDASERDQMVRDGWKYEPDSTLYGVKVKAE